MRIINTALCSFGMSGKVFHAPFIHLNKGFNLYGVWERSQKAAAALYPSIISFNSLEDMLADAAIDLVIVNTPNYTHYDFAKKALLADKHVVVEKSFTVTVSEAEELVTLAKEKNKKLSVFQNRRYDSDFKTVKKIADEGSLGKIVEAEFHFDRFNLNLSPKQHKETTNPGSGLLHDLGPHIIDQALYLFGMPQSVFGFLRTLRPLSVVNDYIDMHLFYPGFTVRLKAGLIVKEIPPAYSLHGTHGSFVKYRADIQEDVLKSGKEPNSKDWGTEPLEASGILNIIKDGETSRTKITSLQGNYMEFYDGIYEAIVHDKKLPVSAEDGLNVMKIIDAVQKSQEARSIVSVL
ncbi:MAG: Gfo/Idh/MocA family oxidoreductase [Ferruginibacter sp.]